MFGSMIGTLGSILRTAGNITKGKYKKRKPKPPKLKRKKGMLKGSIKKRLTKRNTRKYGGFLGKNLNKKGKPKKPTKTKTKIRNKRPTRNRMGLTDAMRRSVDLGPRRRSRKRTGPRKRKPGTLKFKRHLDRKAR